MPMVEKIIFSGDAEFVGMAPCYCVGPQGNDPLCPCRMKEEGQFLDFPKGDPREHVAHDCEIVNVGFD